MIKLQTSDDILLEIFKDFTETVYSFGGPLHFQRYYYRDYPDYNTLPRMAQSDIIKECHARWWKEHSGETSDSNSRSNVQ